MELYLYICFDDNNQIALFRKSIKGGGLPVCCFYIVISCSSRLCINTLLLLLQLLHDHLLLALLPPLVSSLITSIAHTLCSLLAASNDLCENLFWSSCSEAGSSTVLLVQAAY